MEGYTAFEIVNGKEVATQPTGLVIDGQFAYEWGTSYFPQDTHPAWADITPEEQAEYEEAARSIREDLK